MSDDKNIEAITAANEDSGELDENQMLVLDDEVVYPPPVSEEELEEIRVLEEDTRSLPEPPRADLNLKVPYIHQLWDTPDSFNGHWACGPTSATMVLAYYGMLNPYPINVSSPFAHESDYGWYLTNVFSYRGRTFDSQARTPVGWAQGLYGMVVGNVPNLGWCAVASMNGRGMIPLLNTFLGPKYSVKSMSPSQRVVKASLDAYHPVIVSGRPFRLKGHLMVIRGYYYDDYNKTYQWIVNDPYGYQSSGKRRYDGSNVVYSWDEISPKYMYIIS